MQKNKIDIVDLKKKVKNKELQFFLSDGHIHCKDCRIKKSVIVGNCKEIVMNNNGLYIREKR